MSKAKGDARKIAACKSSFAKEVPPKKESEYTLKQRIGRAIAREFETGDDEMYAEYPELIPPKWRTKDWKPSKKKK